MSPTDRSLRVKATGLPEIFAVSSGGSSSIPLLLERFQLERRRVAPENRSDAGYNADIENGLAIYRRRRLQNRKGRLGPRFWCRT